MNETKPQPKVIVFSTPTCSYCNMAKSYFRQKGIKFAVTKPTDRHYISRHSDNTHAQHRSGKE